MRYQHQHGELLNSNIETMKTKELKALPIGAVLQSSRGHLLTYAGPSDTAGKFFAFMGQSKWYFDPEDLRGIPLTGERLRDWLGADPLRGWFAATPFSVSSIIGKEADGIVHVSYIVGGHYITLNFIHELQSFLAGVQLDYEVAPEKLKGGEGGKAE
jgi:hypothetical protein